MDFLKSALSPLIGSGGAVPDTLKLVVIGGTVETARRVSASAWNGFVDSFFLTAHFSQDDHPYDWIMHWLSKQPAWGRSREFDITTRTSGRHAISSAGDLDEDEDGEDSSAQGKKKRKVAFTPSVDTTHTIYYRGHWLRITRGRRYKDYSHCYELKISVVARSNDIIKKLVLEAKRLYEKDAEHRVHIYLADASYPCWRYNGSRQKRPMTSIVLEPGVKEMLLADCKDFLQSEDWYAERGIPFRRGYLLHGVPGSGKTSVIHSLAGELGLDIYVVSLSAKGMSDNTLGTLMGGVPQRCIVLLEDLDAAFTRSVSRDTNATGAPPGASTTNNNNNTSSADNKPAEDGSTLTLSGLLNSLDGVAAAEGRLLFATTNHIERLDPALSRPGRMDVWVNFKHATKWQAEGIFKCFFPFKPSTPASSAPSSTSSSRAGSPSSSAFVSPAASSVDLSQRNLPGAARKPSAHALPLLDEAEVVVLARRFAQSIPEDEFSVASLQGYLLKNKTRPRECVEEVEQWIVDEREVREKLRKQKEEAEAKAKKEADETAKKEKDEKEATEKTEKEKQEKEAKETKEKERAERKEARAKTKKIAAKPETPAADSATSASESSTTGDSSNAGADGDTESVTSESEPEKTNGAAAAPAGESKKEKWVAVKADAVTPAPAAEL